MTTAELEWAPVLADESERPALDQLDRLLACGQPAGSVIAVAGMDPMPLPASALRLLHQVVHQLALGRAVTIVPSGKALTTHQAAAVLNVSRPYLIQLLDRGEIPYTRVGTHRRIQYDDLRRYRHKRDADRRGTLNELTGMSDEYGLYDVEIAGKGR